jgi:cell wall-associated NlpC family hydrolase
MTEIEFRGLCDAQLGKPYIWGASGPDSFDCSGFIEWLLKQLHLAPPDRETAAGLHDYFSWSGHGVAVSTAQLELGDLCFYRNERNHINHVTMAWGDGQVIEAGKGNETTTTVEKAHEMGAMVMISLLNRHPGFFDAIRPIGLHWS